MILFHNYKNAIKIPFLMINDKLKQDTINMRNQSLQIKEIAIQKSDNFFGGIRNQVPLNRLANYHTIIVLKRNTWYRYIREMY